MSSSSDRLLNTPSTTKKSTRTPETEVFGRPYAYYKDHKHGISMNMFIAGFLTVLVCIVDFLLATNIVIYIRTMNADSTEDVMAHTALILLHIALIWCTYKLMVWYINAFGIKDRVKNNKVYQRVANEVIELETLLRPEQSTHERSD